MPVETWDERFTTRMAAQTRRDTGAQLSQFLPPELAGPSRFETLALED